MNRSALARTLVVYVYAKTHGFAQKNLEFFIRTAVNQSHDADYYFILQQSNGIFLNESQLPLLPSNAHYVHHENQCFDIGTIGWFLSGGRIEKTKYKYFIFLNSSGRGPFIVSYYDNPTWYTIFTRRLNDQVKLVGCTINCDQAPHIQSYLWTLDIDGLDLLLKNQTVFTCHQNKLDTIQKGEVGASQIILRSGFGIACLMKKYQGTDFRLKKNHACNRQTNPTINKNVNGISLDPFEVVFVKMKDDMTQFKDNHERLQVYETW